MEKTIQQKNKDLVLGAIDYRVAVGNDQPGFVLESRWKALYEVE